MLCSGRTGLAGQGAYWCRAVSLGLLLLYCTILHGIMSHARTQSLAKYSIFISFLVYISFVCFVVFSLFLFLPRCLCFYVFSLTGTLLSAVCINQFATCFVKHSVCRNPNAVDAYTCRIYLLSYDYMVCC